MRIDPGETIYKDNLINFNDNNLYIIQQGEIDVYYQCNCQYSVGHAKNCNIQKQGGDNTDNLLIIKTLKKNDILGFSLFFFPNSGRVMRAKATTYTELLYINYNQFISLLQQFPSDYERYCYIRDEITLYQNYSILGQSCYFCGDSTHLIKNCNKIHYQFSLEDKKNMFKGQYSSRAKFLRHKKAKSKRIKQNEEEMLKYQKFKMKKTKTLGQYQNLFNLNTQSSISDFEDLLSPKDIKIPEQSLSKKNLQRGISNKTMEHQTSIITSNQTTTQHLQQQQHNKQDILNNRKSNQQIPQAQKQEQDSLVIDDTFYNENSEVYQHNEKKSHQDTSKKEIQQQGSSIADSMILELKPSSYNNLFERGKVELEKSKSRQKKVSNLKKFPHQQSTPLQLQMQQNMPQTQSPQSNHLIVNQNVNYEKRRNSYQLNDSRLSLDSNIMKFLLPTNKFNENGTQIYDHVFTQTVLHSPVPYQNNINSPGIFPFHENNSFSSFFAANQNPLYSYGFLQKTNQTITEPLSEKKSTSIAHKLGINKNSLQNFGQILNDSTVCDFEFYYPNWNHLLILGKINGNENSVMEQSQNMRKSFSQQQSSPNNSYQQKSNKRSHNPSLTSKRKSCCKENSQYGLQNINNQSYTSNVPLKSNFVNQSYEQEHRNLNQYLNIESPQLNKVNQNTNPYPNSPQQPSQCPSPSQINLKNNSNLSPKLKREKKVSYQRKPSNSQSILHQNKNQNVIKKLPTDHKLKNNNINNEENYQNEQQEYNYQNSSEIYSNNTIQYGHQKSREMRFVESQYSFNKGFSHLNKDKKKSEISNIINYGFNSRNKTVEYTQNEDTQIYHGTLTEENDKETDFQQNQSLKDQHNLIYSHYNSAKNENVNETDQSHRPEAPNNFNFPVNHQSINQ